MSTADQHGHLDEESKITSIITITPHNQDVVRTTSLTVTITDGGRGTAV